MPRLADEILLDGLPMFEGDYDLMKTYRGRTDEIQRLLLQEVPVIVVDNVADYIFAEGGEGDWQYDAHSFPNIAPPFEAWWMEYSRPRDTDFVDVKFVGALVTVFDLKDAELGMLLDKASPELFASLNGAEPRWVMQFQQVIKRERGLYAPSSYLLAVGDSGEPLGGVVGALDGLLFSDEMIADTEDLHRVVGGGFQLIRPMLLALSLMHCKNVNVVQQRAPRHERRRAEKEGVRPPLKFSTVNITPMQRVLRTEGNSGEVGLKKAMHICRGHFKNFDDKPLFGRVRGTFWWGSQVRGTKSGRKVVHDYNVKAST